VRDVTRLLVLGGTAMVGRALVDAGLARGWQVTTFNRGLTSRDGIPPAVLQLRGDRTAADPAALAPLRSGEWDLVVDTWAGAPSAARAAARALRECTRRYVYVSSGSVYDDPPRGVDESWPAVTAVPGADATDYAADKRGAELAVSEVFGERALFARAGLILGPHENVGRLPWWLARMARGGEVLAPGPPDRPLQFIDARDLAAFVLEAALGGLSGPCNVVGRRGAAVTRDLLEACAAVAGAPGTALTWVAPGVIEGAGIEPWTELPIWLPPDGEAEWLFSMDGDRAFGAGLSTRPLGDTIADTWAWLRTLPGGLPAPAPGRPRPGVSPERETAALALAHRVSG
jgi:2'-hydroxyisoflavone reductase